jgi:uncharacterized membrane protein
MTQRPEVMMFSLMRGTEGHPLHPPLTDAAIGAYTVATVFAVVGAFGWIEDAAGKTAWLALLVGLGAGAASALTGLAELSAIPRPSETFRTAAIHGGTMASATALFVLAAVFQYDGFHNGSVTTAGLVLTTAAFLVLTLGGWLGGSLVFRHGMRVSPANEKVIVRTQDSRPRPLHQQSRRAS